MHKCIIDSAVRGYPSGAHARHGARPFVPRPGAKGQGPTPNAPGPTPQAHWANGQPNADTAHGGAAQVRFPNAQTGAWDPRAAETTAQDKLVWANSVRPRRMNVSVRDAQGPLGCVVRCTGADAADNDVTAGLSQWVRAPVVSFMRGGRDWSVWRCGLGAISGRGRGVGGDRCGERCAESTALCTALCTALLANGMRWR